MKEKNIEIQSFCFISNFKYEYFRNEEERLKFEETSSHNKKIKYKDFPQDVSLKLSGWSILEEMKNLVLKMILKSGFQKSSKLLSPDTSKEICQISRINDCNIKAVIKMTILHDIENKIFTYAICSLNDHYSKRYGVHLVKKRHVEALKILKNGVPGKTYKKKGVLIPGNKINEILILNGKC